VSRVAPVFDPATRTAEMEVEVANADFRLKPGMYSRVHLTVGQKPDALRVPANAVVTVEGQSGVFIATAPPAGEVAPATQAVPPDQQPLTVRFQPVETGIRDGQQIEITSGLVGGCPRHHHRGRRAARWRPRAARLDWPPRWRGRAGAPGGNTPGPQGSSQGNPR
jgi:hypothetical protein